MALSGHPQAADQCPLSGVQRVQPDLCAFGPIKSGTFCKLSSQQPGLGRPWEDPKQGFSTQAGIPSARINAPAGLLMAAGGVAIWDLRVALNRLFSGPLDRRWRQCRPARRRIIQPSLRFRPGIRRFPLVTFGHRCATSSALTRRLSTLHKRRGTTFVFSRHAGKLSRPVFRARAEPPGDRDTPHRTLGPMDKEPRQRKV